MMSFINDLFSSKNRKKIQQPEDLYKTEITDVYIKVTHPRRADEIINWDEIEAIKIANTDEGPFLPDVWLLLIGKEKGCSIPHGSKGWEEVYNIVSKYPGFNFENAIKSACCADNEIFDLWKK
jgi:hypothetical protein